MKSENPGSGATKEDIQKILDGIFEGKIKLSYNIDLEDFDDQLQKKLRPLIDHKSKRRSKVYLYAIAIMSLMLVVASLYFYTLIGRTLTSLDNDGLKIKTYHLGSSTLYMNYHTQGAFNLDTTNNILHIANIAGEIFIDNTHGDGQYISIFSDDYSFTFLSGKVNFIHRNGIIRITPIATDVFAKKMNDNGETFVIKSGQYFDFTYSDSISIKKVKNPPLSEHWTDSKFLSYNEVPLIIIIQDLQARTGKRISMEGDISQYDKLVVSGNYSLQEGIIPVISSMLPENYQVKVLPDSSLLIFYDKFVPR